MFTYYFLPILFLSLTPLKSRNTSSNLLSNEMIQLDKNLGAFYLYTEISILDINDPYFYYKLDKRLLNISPTLDYEKMGIEITYIDTNNLLQEEKHIIASNMYPSLFNRYDSYYQFKDELTTSGGIIEYKYYPSSKIYSIKLNNDISLIKNISIYYGDNSVNIISAYLGIQVENIYNLESLPTYKEDKLNYHLLYMDRINYLTSNYGYSISLSYLKRHYRIINPNTEEIYEIENYYFPNSDNNFNNVLLGSRYYLNVQSSSRNIDAIIEIKIVDNLSPIVEKWNFGDISFDSSVFNSQNDVIYNYFYIKDNYSKGDYLLVKISTYNEIFISGKYYINIQGVDQFNNSTNNKFLVSVKDNTRPNISLLYSYIITSKNNHYSSEELLSYFVIEDSESIKEIIITNNTYFGNEDIPGRYIFEVTAIDKNNNYSSSLLYIEVKDDDASLIKNYYRHFYYQYLEKVDIEEIVSILIYDEVIPKNEYTSMKIIEGEDINKILLPGDYFFLLEFEYSSGKIYEEFIIHISKKEEINSTKKISFLDFIKTLFKELKNIFTNRR